MAVSLGGSVRFPFSKGQFVCSSQLRGVQFLQFPVFPVTVPGRFPVAFPSKHRMFSVFPVSLRARIFVSFVIAPSCTA
jgi:hypothetical protein